MKGIRLRAFAMSLAMCAGAVPALAITPRTEAMRRGLQLTQIHLLRGPTGPLGTTASFTPAGHLVASSGEDGQVRVWRVWDGELYRTLPGHTTRPDNCAVFSPDGKLLAAAGRDGDALIWSVPDGRRRGEPVEPAHGGADADH